MGGKRCYRCGRTRADHELVEAANDPTRFIRICPASVFQALDEARQEQLNRLAAPTEDREPESRDVRHRKGGRP